MAGMRPSFTCSKASVVSFESSRSSPFRVKAGKGGREGGSEGGREGGGREGGREGGRREGGGKEGGREGGRKGEWEGGREEGGRIRMTREAKGTATHGSGVKVQQTPHNVPSLPSVTKCV